MMQKDLSALPLAQTNSTGAAAGRTDHDLAELVRACARDERQALEALYRATAPALYGRALAAAGETAAEQALIGTYLDAFSEAASVDPDTVAPRHWLDSLLERHLPEAGQRPLGPETARPATLPPPTELWQRLDIALGLRRLDQHIKPGIATMERGRDPMPNHHDRRRDRRLAFWRGTALASLAGLVLVVAVVLMRELSQGEGPVLAGDPGSLAEAQAAAPLPATATAILQPGGQRRIWRVDLDAGRVLANALPPFRHQGGGMLTLWATAEGDSTMHRLGNLDPMTTATLDLPGELAGDVIGFVITLERSATGATPEGPALFSGRLER